MNVNLLKSKMALKGDAQIDLAKAMGITKASMTVKMQGKNPFKLEEIKFIAKRYNLTNDEIADIFVNEV